MLFIGISIGIVAGFLLSVVVLRMISSKDDAQNRRFQSAVRGRLEALEAKLDLLAGQSMSDRDEEASSIIVSESEPVAPDGDNEAETVQVENVIPEAVKVPKEVSPEPESADQPASTISKGKAAKPAENLKPEPVPTPTATVEVKVPGSRDSSTPEVSFRVTADLPHPEVNEPADNKQPVKKAEKEAAKVAPQPVKKKPAPAPLSTKASTSDDPLLRTMAREVAKGEGTISHTRGMPLSMADLQSKGKSDPSESAGSNDQQAGSADSKKIELKGIFGRSLSKKEKKP